MQRYEEIFNEMGYKHQCDDFIFEGEKGLFYVEHRNGGYHKIAFCPTGLFDMWANSKHINFRLMVENYDGCFGWTQEQVENDLRSKIKDCELLSDIIPKRYFDNFIKIEL